MNPKSSKTTRTPASRVDWSTSGAAELYGVEDWGLGYFGVSAQGTVEVYPEVDPSRGVDLMEVVEAAYRSAKERTEVVL